MKLSDHESSIHAPKMNKITQFTKWLHAKHQMISNIIIPIMLALSILYMTENVIEGIFLRGSAYGFAGLSTLDGQMSFCLTHLPILYVGISILLGFVFDIYVLRWHPIASMRKVYWIFLILGICSMIAGHYYTLSMVGPIDSETFKTIRYMICS